MTMFSATIDAITPEILASQSVGFADYSATDANGAANVVQQWNAQLNALFPPELLDDWTDMGFDLTSFDTVFGALDAIVTQQLGLQNGNPVVSLTYMEAGQAEPWYSCGRNCHTAMKQLATTAGENVALMTLDVTPTPGGTTWRAVVRLRYTAKQLQAPPS